MNIFAKLKCFFSRTKKKNEISSFDSRVALAPSKSEKFNERFSVKIDLVSAYSPIHPAFNPERKLVVVDLLKFSCKINGEQCSFLVKGDMGLFKNEIRQMFMTCAGAVFSQQGTRCFGIHFSGSTGPNNTDIYLNFNVVCNEVIEIIDPTCSMKILFSSPEDELEYTMECHVYKKDR